MEFWKTDMFRPRSDVGSHYLLIPSSSCCTCSPRSRSVCNGIGGLESKGKMGNCWLVTSSCLATWRVPAPTESILIALFLKADDRRGIPAVFKMLEWLSTHWNESSKSCVSFCTSATHHSWSYVLFVFYFPNRSSCVALVTGNFDTVNFSNTLKTLA